jgi:hypothetical protein
MDFNLFSKMLAMDKHTPRGAPPLLTTFAPCESRRSRPALSLAFADVGHLFTEMDKDEDGKISQSEFA